MTPRKILRMIGTGLLTWVIALPGEASDTGLLVFTYTRHTQRTQPDGDASTAGSTQETDAEENTVEIKLDVDRVAVRSDSQETVYDFRSRRVYQLDHGNKTYSHHSLFAIPAFRESEFENRLFLMRVFREAAAKPQPIDLYATECELGITGSNGQETRIEQKARRDGLEFFVHGEKVAAVFYSQHPIPPDLRSMFSKFLIYETQLHPKIREGLEPFGYLPRRIQYGWSDLGGGVRVEWSLEGAPSSENWVESLPPGYTQVSGSTTEPGRQLYEIARAVRDGQAAVPKPSKEDFLRMSADAVKRNNFLEATLVQTEYFLQTGVKDPDMMARLREIMQDSGRTAPDIQRFHTGLDLSSREASKRAVEALTSIRRDGLQRSHVVDIMLANADAAIGNVERGQTLLLGVLRANPYITSAYNDLGTMFLRQYDTASAWRCWDVARELYPDHPLLQRVSQMESRLISEFPEHF